VDRNDPPWWDKYEHFDAWEFDCKHTGENHMREEFIRKLNNLREAFGGALIVHSGWRHATHPAEAKKSKPGTHNMGIAADLRVGPGLDAYRIVQLAMQMGFTGIGISQRNGYPRFIHLDINPNRKAVWSY